MKKKILVLGATGMIGHMVYHHLISSGKYDIEDAGFNTKLSNKTKIIDLSNQNEVLSYVTQYSPDVIVNCAGVLIRKSTSDPDYAVLLNSYLPLYLQRITKGASIKIIQCSTDCVFSGKKGSYSADDKPDAEDYYGRTKALGELKNKKDLTIRTSTIGPELKDSGEGLLHWFLHQKEDIFGYANAFWSGVTTLELSRVIEHAIDENLTGLVHITNGEKISKYNLLKMVKEIWDVNNINIHSSTGVTVDKSLIPSTLMNYSIPTYREMLIDLKRWMSLHPDLYRDVYKGVEYI